MSYPRGAVARVDVELRNDAGELADPTALVLKVIPPSGEEQAYTWQTDAEVVKDSTGVFHAGIKLTEAGEWDYRWEATGSVETAANGGLLVARDAFEGGAKSPIPLASIEDFEARHGAADESARALLEDASALILSEVVGATSEWATGKAPVPVVVKAICVEVAYRAWSNPDSLSSEQLGQHTQAWADRSGQALRLTPAELRILEREASVSSLVSVTLESPYAGRPIESDLIE